MKYNRLMLASVVLTMVSIMMGILTFFVFSPLTFFIQLSVGVAAGFMGFIGLVSILFRAGKKKKILAH